MRAKPLQMANALVIEVLVYSSFLNFFNPMFHPEADIRHVCPRVKYESFSDNKPEKKNYF